MPYSATRRHYNMYGKKISKQVLYRKAKRLCNEINRNMSLLEARYLRTRLHHV